MTEERCTPSIRFCSSTKALLLKGPILNQSKERCHGSLRPDSYRYAASCRNLQGLEGIAGACWASIMAWIGYPCLASSGLYDSVPGYRLLGWAKTGTTALDPELLASVRSTPNETVDPLPKGPKYPKTHMYMVVGIWFLYYEYGFCIRNMVSVLGIITMALGQDLLLECLNP